MADLIKNGDFESNIDGWIADWNGTLDNTIRWDAGTLESTSIDWNGPYYKVGPVEAGSEITFRIKVRLVSGAATEILVDLWSPAGLDLWRIIPLGAVGEYVEDEITFVIPEAYAYTEFGIYHVDNVGGQSVIGVDFIELSTPQKPLPLLPPLPAVDSAHIEIFGPDAAAPKWDSAIWDESQWANFEWRDIQAQTLAVQVSWGADDPQGVLTAPAAGSWSVNTFDPNRLLDPSNGLSAYANAIKPGRPIRIIYERESGEHIVVRQGIIDEVTYDIAAKTGQLRGTDQVQLLVNAKLPEGQDLDLGMPNTLRARAAYLIAKAGLNTEVEGGDDYKRIIRESEPTVWWRLNEKLVTDAVVDSTVNPINGSIVGAVIPGEPALIAGDTTSFKFAGGHIEFPNTGGQFFGASWMIEGWVRVDAYPPAGQLWTILEKGNNAPWIYIKPDGHIEIAIKGGQGQSNSNIPLELGVPHLVSFIRDGAANATYTFIDGEDRTVHWSQMPFGPGAGVLKLGSPEFAGWLDEWTIYNRAVDMTLPRLHYFYGIADVGLYDPPVGLAESGEATVWAHILTAALDALYVPWVDRLGVLRFRSYGNPTDSGLQVGGLGGVAIETLQTTGSLQGVYTRVRAFDETAPEAPIESVDEEKARIYGDIIYERERPIPNAAEWVESVLADRSGAALQYLPGILRPQTEAQMDQLLSLGMMDVAHVAVDSILPSINVAARVLGGKLNADVDNGWSAEVITYIPSSEWDENIEAPPAIPNYPGEVVTVVRLYECIKSADVIRSGNGNAGAGAGPTLAVGMWKNKRRRAFVDFEAIDWSDVVNIQMAELLLITQQNCVEFGERPKVVARRVTQNWSEGTVTTCVGASNNAIVYPGPKTTNSGASTRILRSNEEDEIISINVTNIVRAWRNGSKKFGIGLFSGGEDNPKFTTEFSSRHHAETGRHPHLRLTVQVPVI